MRPILLEKATIAANPHFYLGIFKKGRNGIDILDFYVDDEENDLVLCATDNDDVIDYFIICEETDIYFSRIGRHDSDLDVLRKVN